MNNTKDFIWTESLESEFAIGIFNGKYDHVTVAQAREGFIKSKTPELPFEILSLRSMQGHELNIDKFKSLADIPLLEEYMSNAGYYIRSVRRKSDGEIFSVEEDTADGKIIRFDVVADGGVKKTIVALFDFGATQHILKLRKKEKAFIATDGKECFNGDTIYGVAILATGQDVIRTQKLPFPVRLGQPGHNRVWFSERAKAVNYILKNKACLSVNDTFAVLNHHEDVSFCYDGIIAAATEKLKNLI